MKERKGNGGTFSFLGLFISVTWGTYNLGKLGKFQGVTGLKNQKTESRVTIAALK